jgi:hypothetical protein
MATREVETMPGWKETYDSFGAGGIRTRTSAAYRANYDAIDWKQRTTETLARRVWKWLLGFVKIVSA